MIEVVLVGCPELEDRPAAKMEKDSRRDDFAEMLRHRYKPLVAGYHKLEDVLEKPPRLGRQAVMPSGSAVQPVERRHGSARMLQIDRDTLFLSLANVAVCAVSKGLAHFDCLGVERQGVDNQLRSGRLFFKKGFPATNVEVFPTGLSPVGDDSREQSRENIRVPGNWVAQVRERKRHPALAGEEAVDLHHGDETGQSTFFDDGEIERLIPVGLVQHLGPGGGVEEGGLVAGFEQGIPVGVGRWVYNLNLCHLIYFHRPLRSRLGEHGEFCAWRRAHGAEREALGAKCMALSA